MTGTGSPERPRARISMTQFGTGRGLGGPRRSARLAGHERVQRPTRAGQGIPRAPAGRRRRLRRRHGHDAVRPRRVREPLLRRAEPLQPGAGAAPSTRSTSRRAPTSSRPTPSAPTASSSGPTASTTRCARSTARARAWPARRPRAGAGGGIDRPAGQAPGAARQHHVRRGGRRLPRAGGRPGRGRRRPLRDRDDPRARPGPGRRHRHPRRERAADHRLHDVHGGGHHVLRRQARGRRAHPRGLGRHRGGRELQPGPAADAGDGAAHGRGRAPAEALGHAERGRARHGGRPLRLPLHARIHGLLRAALHRGRRHRGRRLLRDHARPHPQPRALRAHGAAGAPGRHDRAAGGGQGDAAAHPARGEEPARAEHGQEVRRLRGARSAQGRGRRAASSIARSTARRTRSTPSTSPTARAPPRA